MSNVKRGERAVNSGARPLKVGETIEEQKDGSVLSVIKREPRTAVDPKTGEVREIPTSDARTSRVDMPDDRAGGAEPWYLKHMIPCAERAEVVAREEEEAEVVEAARKKFEEERDAKRPVNPIRAQADALDAAKKKASKKKGKVAEKSDD